MNNRLQIAAIALPACAMLALAEPAAAEERANAAAASAAAVAAVRAKPPETKRVCMNVVLDTGSRLARRMCMTKAEWANEGVDLDARK